MRILAIETSCDETAASVVDDGTKEVSHSLASSEELHKKTGGIVPEVAARKQVEYIVPVVDQCLENLISAGNYTSREVAIKSLDALAVTTGPGLIGSLLVGVEAAKALSLAWDKPLTPVNHLVGHIYANWLVSGETPEFPLVALVVSGGHTDLVLMRDHGDLEFLGGTVDDAAGEAFDKTARLLGLARYLGGSLLSQKASECENNTLAGVLPRPMIDQPNYDFSFSGLKTAVRRLIEMENPPAEVVACEFETAVVDVLVAKTIKAAKDYCVKTILLGGGVSANRQLRHRISLEAEKLGMKVHIPPVDLCTDNAAYIASTAYFNFRVAPLLKEIKADPSLGIMD